MRGFWFCQDVIAGYFAVPWFLLLSPKTIIPNPASDRVMPRSQEVSSSAGLVSRGGTILAKITPIAAVIIPASQYLMVFPLCEVWYCSNVNATQDGGGNHAGYIWPHREWKNHSRLICFKSRLLSYFGSCRYAGYAGNTY